MSFAKNITQKIKTFFQLGPRQSFNFLIYQIGLRSGYFTLTTPALEVNTLLDDKEIQPNWFLTLPDRNRLNKICGPQINNLMDEADEILQRKIRFFGGETRSLSFSPEKNPAHWSHYERGAARGNIKDIKYIWEPARFNWAITLAKAYFYSRDEKYAAAFWQYFEEFNQANPINKGLNWTSAQEVALRLIALTVSASLLENSPHSNPKRLVTLCICIADHASRIPPTISYAKAQNNNHFLSEAVGLYTASVFLPDHPQAAKWQEKGIRWFNQAISAQIADDGTYIQHSANYHRLMLMLALWMQVLLEKNNLILNDETLNKLAAASEWLSVRLDRFSGQVPNLGHNDGSHILPLTNAAFNDYRPVVQAASRAFQARAALPPGPWDDLCLWLDIPVQNQTNTRVPEKEYLEHLVIGSEQSWAALRAVRFSSRPAHADQLHVDIWHHGMNIALDAGTFQYNAPPPWENALAATVVHNTVTINSQSQMTRAGKFLWLDWAQAAVEKMSPDSITAVQLGYQNLGIIHRRTLTRCKKDGWLILDELQPTPLYSGKITAVLHWLVPDWPFQIQAGEVNLESPLGKIGLDISLPGQPSVGTLDIFKAGESLITDNKNIHLGWYSPTYGQKISALSIRFEVCQPAPIQIQSIFHLPDLSG
jgi:hypothetical protein